MKQILVSEELLQQVIEVIDDAVNAWGEREFPIKKVRTTQHTIRTALEQPAAEPFGWIKSSEIESSARFGGPINLWRNQYDCDVPVFTAPQAQHRSTAIAECLQVLRPTVEGKFPQEQALEELVGYLSAPQAQEKS